MTMPVQIRVLVEALEASRVSFDAAEWGDTCMGLASDDDFCGQAITRGWIVKLDTAIYHVSESGSVRKAA